jgi:hypothetical protein
MGYISFHNGAGLPQRALLAQFFWISIEATGILFSGTSVKSDDTVR